jgi:hypothetical protein
MSAGRNAPLVPAAWLLPAPTHEDAPSVPSKRLRWGGGADATKTTTTARGPRVAVPLPPPLPPPPLSLDDFAYEQPRGTPVLPLASLSSAATAAREGQRQQPKKPPPPPAPPPSVLPIAARHHGTPQRYVWDGRRIVAVSASLLEQQQREQQASPGTTLSPPSPTARLQDTARRLAVGLRGAFAPAPEDVSPDYWEWLRWRLSQRFFSSTLQNFATQSLLVAVGVGAKRSLAAGAVINWMLKDGVSRLVRMGVATSFGASFDSDLKRFRFATSLLFTACFSCEFAAPFFPQHFLALASVSNVGRAVGLTTFVSSQPAFMQALSAGGNLADLSAKTQAQHMAVDTAALAVAATANWLLRTDEGRRALLPVVAFPLLSAADLYCIYRELKAVELRTINRERAEMIAERWLAVRGGATTATTAATTTAPVPSRREVSDAESLLGPPNIAGGFLPMRILPLEEVVDTPDELFALLRDYGEVGGGGKKKERQRWRQRPQRRRGDDDGNNGNNNKVGGARHLLALKPGDVDHNSSPSSSPPQQLAAALRRRLPARLAAVLPGAERPPHLAVALAEEPAPRDVLRAVLEAGILRRSLAREAGLELPPAVGLGAGGRGDEDKQQKNNAAAAAKAKAAAEAERDRAERAVAAMARAPDGSPAAERLARLRADARRQAECDVDALMRDLEDDGRGRDGGGWQLRPLLLSTDERRGYRLL